MIEVKINKKHKNVKTPTYATDGSGCFDLYASHAGHVSQDDPTIFETGLKFEIPENHVMLIFSRSGHGFKDDVRLSNCVGVIDHDYRGEVMVKLCADNDGMLTVNEGDRIAQAIVVPYPKVTFIEVDDLSETERGTGGFGHTGA